MWVPGKPMKTTVTKVTKCSDDVLNISYFCLNVLFFYVSYETWHPLNMVVTNDLTLVIQMKDILTCFLVSADHECQYETHRAFLPYKSTGGGLLWQKLSDGSRFLVSY